MQNTLSAPLGQGRVADDWHTAHRVSRGIRVTDALLPLNFYVRSLVDRHADPCGLSSLDDCPTAAAVSYDRARLRTHTDDVLTALAELEAALRLGGIHAEGRR